MPCISVIITNYNYGCYVGAAIQSALGLSGGAEVIVVDDGSTDNSRSVIDAFGSSVLKIYQTNQSQTAACNAGFAASTGDVVIFLDSDDVLDPSVGEELRSIWNERVSKVQFQMQRIDECGRPRGGVFPAYLPLPTPDRIRRWVMTTGAYPTPPGSGNAYARRWLKKIFPLDPEADRFGDSFCLSAAPLFGEVVTVAKPLVFYRLHGANDSKQVSFAKHAERAMKRFKYGQELARHMGIELADGLLFRSLETTQFRAASMRFAREQHPIPGDSPFRVVRNALWSLAFFSQLDLRRRGVLVLWVLGVLLLPLPLAKRAAAWRYRR